MHKHWFNTFFVGFLEKEKKERPTSSTSKKRGEKEKRDPK